MTELREKKLYCRRPFEAIEAKPGGDIVFCCWADQYIVGNVANENLANIWNSPKAIAFRDSIFDGSYRYCDRGRCPYIKEGNSDHSNNLIDSKKTEGELREFLPWDVADAIKNELRFLWYPPKSTTLSYDTTCNLTCPSCRTKYINQNSQKDKFRNMFEKLKPYGENLVMSGAGDPFASAHFLDIMLKSLPGDLKLVRTITIITNGLLLTKELWDKVSPEIKEKNVDLSISIDAANEETYVINRRGGNWNRLLENLDFISNCSDFRNIELSFVVQENNFRQMKDFVLVAKKFRANKIIFRKLSNWGTYTTKAYLIRNLYSKLHPLHQEYFEMLQDPIFKDAQVELPPLDHENSYLASTVLPGLGFEFISLAARKNVINVGEQVKLYTFNDANFEKDFFESEKGPFSRRVVATKDQLMGFGYFHELPFSLAQYRELRLTVKSSLSKNVKHVVLLRDVNKEVQVDIGDFGFKADGTFHDITIPLAEFSREGIDLAKVIYSFGMVAYGSSVGDSFYLSDLHML